jgi:hypothetical protein
MCILTGELREGHFLQCLLHGSFPHSRAVCAVSLACHAATRCSFPSVTHLSSSVHRMPRNCFSGSSVVRFVVLTPLCFSLRFALLAKAISEPSLLSGDQSQCTSQLPAIKEPFSLTGTSFPARRCMEFVPAALMSNTCVSFCCPRLSITPPPPSMHRGAHFCRSNTLELDSPSGSSEGSLSRKRAAKGRKRELVNCARVIPLPSLIPTSVLCLCMA